MYLVIDQRSVKKLDKDKVSKIYQVESNCLKNPRCDPNSLTITPKQLQYVTVDSKSFLVMCTNLGLQIWSELGENVLLFHPISSTVTNAGPESEPFFRGVAATGRFICAGASDGSFVVIGKLTPLLCVGLH